MRARTSTGWAINHENGTPWYARVLRLFSQIDVMTTWRLRHRVVARPPKSWGV